MICARAFDGDRVDPSPRDQRVLVDATASDDRDAAGLRSGGDVCGGRRLCSGDDVMGRRFGRRRSHPAPESRLKGDDCVGGH